LLTLAFFRPLYTINYLAVNHITKELFWAESDTSEEGFIGWEIIPERSLHEDLNNYLELEHTYTDFPYKLDIIASLFILLPLLLLIVRRKRRKNKT